MACIQLDGNTVTGVLNDKGEQSELYKALKIYNEKEALRLWAITQTDGFKKYYGSETTESGTYIEPSIEDIQAYIRNYEIAPELGYTEDDYNSENSHSKPNTNELAIYIKNPDGTLSPTGLTLKKRQYKIDGLIKLHKELVAEKSKNEQYFPENPRLKAEYDAAIIKINNAIAASKNNQVVSQETFDKLHSSNETIGVEIQLNNTGYTQRNQNRKLISLGEAIGGNLANAPIFMKIDGTNTFTSKEEYKATTDLVKKANESGFKGIQFYLIDTALDGSQQPILMQKQHIFNFKEGAEDTKIKKDIKEVIRRFASGKVLSEEFENRLGNLFQFKEASKEGVGHVFTWNSSNRILTDAKNKTIFIAPVIGKNDEYKTVYYKTDPDGSFDSAKLELGLTEANFIELTEENQAEAFQGIGYDLSISKALEYSINYPIIGEDGVLQDKNGKKPIKEFIDESQCLMMDVKSVVVDNQEGKEIRSFFVSPSYSVIALKEAQEVEVKKGIPVEKANITTDPETTDNVDEDYADFMSLSSVKTRVLISVERKEGSNDFINPKYSEGSKDKRDFIRNIALDIEKVMKNNNIDIYNAIRKYIKDLDRKDSKQNAIGLQLVDTMEKKGFEKNDFLKDLISQLNEFGISITLSKYKQMNLGNSEFFADGEGLVTEVDKNAEMKEVYHSDTSSFEINSEDVISVRLKRMISKIPYSQKETNPDGSFKSEEFIPVVNKRINSFTYIDRPSKFLSRIREIITEVLTEKNNNEYEAILKRIEKYGSERNEGQFVEFVNQMRASDESLVGSFMSFIKCQYVDYVPTKFNIDKNGVTTFYQEEFANLEASNYFQGRVLKSPIMTYNAKDGIVEPNRDKINGLIADLKRNKTGITRVSFDAIYSRAANNFISGKPNIDLELGLEINFKALVQLGFSKKEATNITYNYYLEKNSNKALSEELVTILESVLTGSASLEKQCKDMNKFASSRQAKSPVSYRNGKKRFKYIKRNLGFKLIAQIYKYKDNIINNNPAGVTDREIILLINDRKRRKVAVEFLKSEAKMTILDDTSFNNQFVEAKDLTNNDRRIIDINSFLNTQIETKRRFISPLPQLGENSNIFAFESPNLLDFTAKSHAFNGNTLTKVTLKDSKIKPIIEYEVMRIQDTIDLFANKEKKHLWKKNRDFVIENGQEVLGLGARFLMFPMLNENEKMQELMLGGVLSITKMRQKFGEQTPEERIASVTRFIEEIISEDILEQANELAAELQRDQLVLSNNGVLSFSNSFIKIPEYQPHDITINGNPGTVAPSIVLPLLFDFILNNTVSNGYYQTLFNDIANVAKPVINKQTKKLDVNSSIVNTTENLVKRGKKVITSGSEAMHKSISARAIIISDVNVSLQETNNAEFNDIINSKTAEHLKALAGVNEEFERYVIPATIGKTDLADYLTNIYASNKELVDKAKMDFDQFMSVFSTVLSPLFKTYNEINTADGVFHTTLDFHLAKKLDLSYINQVEHDLLLELYSQTSMEVYKNAFNGDFDLIPPGNLKNMLVNHYENNKSGLKDLIRYGLTPTKPVYTSFEHYFKCAEFPIIPLFHNSTELGNLLQLMKDTQNDVVMYESASKLLTENGVNFTFDGKQLTNFEGKTASGKTQSISMNMDYYLNQTETQGQTKTKIRNASQFIKVIFMDYVEDGSNLLGDFLDAHEGLLSELYKEFVDKNGIMETTNGPVFKNLRSFRDFLTKAIDSSNQASDVDQQLLDSLELSGEDKIQEIREKYKQLISDNRREKRLFLKTFRDSLKRVKAEIKEVKNQLGLPLPNKVRTDLFNRLTTAKAQRVSILAEIDIQTELLNQELKQIKEGQKMEESTVALSEEWLTNPFFSFGFGKFESLILSAYEKSVVDFKIKGTASIISSETGVTHMITYNKNAPVNKSILWTRPGNQLEWDEIIVPFAYETADGRKLAIEDFLDENGDLDMNLVPEEILKCIGFRVPIQGLSSMAPLRIAGFLPSFMGSTCIANKNLVGRMGSDFDSDKLYLEFPNVEFAEGNLKNKQVDEYIASNYKRQEKQVNTANGPAIAVTHFIGNTQIASKESEGILMDYFDLLEQREQELEIAIEENNTEVINNEPTELAEARQEVLDKLIVYKDKAVKGKLKNVDKSRTDRHGYLQKMFEIKYARLTSPDIRGSLTYPNHYGEILSIGKTVGEFYQKGKLRPLGYLTIEAQRNEAITGRKGVGIYSDWVTSVVKLQQSGLELFEGAKHNVIINGKTFTIGSMGGIQKNGIYKASEALTILQSIMVDNLKMGAAGKVNLRDSTFSTVGLLNLLGIPLKESLYFINTPLARKYFEDYDKYRKSGYSQKDAIDMASGKEMTNRVIKEKGAEFEYYKTIPTINFDKISSFMEVTSNGSLPIEGNADMLYALAMYHSMSNEYYRMIRDVASDTEMLPRSTIAAHENHNKFIEAKYSTPKFFTKVDMLSWNGQSNIFTNYQKYGVDKVERLFQVTASGKTISPYMGMMGNFITNKAKELFNFESSKPESLSKILGNFQYYLLNIANTETRNDYYNELIVNKGLETRFNQFVSKNKEYEDDIFLNSFSFINGVLKFSNAEDIDYSFVQDRYKNNGNSAYTSLMEDIFSYSLISGEIDRVEDFRKLIPNQFINEFTDRKLQEIYGSNYLMEEAIESFMLSQLISNKSLQKVAPFKAATNEDEARENATFSKEISVQRLDIKKMPTEEFDENGDQIKVYPAVVLIANRSYLYNEATSSYKLIELVDNIYEGSDFSKIRDIKDLLYLTTPLKTADSITAFKDAHYRYSNSEAINSDASKLFYSILNSIKSNDIVITQNNRSVTNYNTITKTLTINSSNNKYLNGLQYNRYYVNLLPSVLTIKLDEELLNLPKDKKDEALKTITELTGRKIVTPLDLNFALADVAEMMISSKEKSEEATQKLEELQFMIGANLKSLSEVSSKIEMSNAQKVQKILNNGTGKANQMMSIFSNPRVTGSNYNKVNGVFITFAENATADYYYQVLAKNTKEITLEEFIEEFKIKLKSTDKIYHFPALLTSDVIFLKPERDGLVNIGYRGLVTAIFKAVGDDFVRLSFDQAIAKEFAKKPDNKLYEYILSIDEAGLDKVSMEIPTPPQLPFVSLKENLKEQLASKKELTEEEADMLMDRLREITEKYNSSTLADSVDPTLKEPIKIKETTITAIEPRAGDKSHIWFERISGKWLAVINEKDGKLKVDLAKINEKGTYYVVSMSDEKLNELIKEAGLEELINSIYKDTSVKQPKERRDQFEIQNALQQKYNLKRTYKDIVTELKEQLISKEELLNPKGTINVYWGQAESATSTKILSNLAPRKFIYQDKEYGSVEHAYQSLKSGAFDQVTYNAYIKAGGYGTKIRGKAVRQGFDNLQLMKNLVVESFKQNPDSEAAKKLLQYENFTHNTNEVIDKAFLEGLKLAQQALLTIPPKDNILSFDPNNIYRLGEYRHLYEKYELLNKKGEIKNVDGLSKEELKDWLDKLNRSNKYSFGTSKTPSGTKIFISKRYDRLFNSATVSGEPKTKVLAKQQEVKMNYFNGSEEQRASFVLSNIAKSSHPLNKLAGYVANFMAINDVVMSFKENQKSVYDDIAMGIYNPNNNKIEIAGLIGSYNEWVAIHESIHAVTSFALKSGSKEAQDFNALYEHAKQFILDDKVDPENGFYGMTDVDEFMAELLSNAKFVEKLKTLPAKEGIKYNNLFEELVDILMKMLNLSPSNSLYEQAISVASHIIKNKQTKAQELADLQNEIGYDDYMNEQAMIQEQLDMMC